MLLKILKRMLTLTNTRFDKNKATNYKFLFGYHVSNKNEEQNQTLIDPKFGGPSVIQISFNIFQ